MNDTPTVRNDHNQRLIDEGTAMLLRMPNDLTALTVATAHQMAKDGGYQDWRVCVGPACRLVRRLALREAFARLQRQGVTQ